MRTNVLTLKIFGDLSEAKVYHFLEGGDFRDILGVEDFDGGEHFRKDLLESVHLKDIVSCQVQD